MSFEIIDDMTLADIAFVARGRDLGELFSSGARALLFIMLDDPASVARTEKLSFHVDSPVLDLLYYAFLQEILYYKDAKGLLLVPENVEVCERDGHWFCSCAAAGEAIDALRHDFITDIKAVTLHGLEVKRDGDGWASKVIVDV